MSDERPGDMVPAGYYPMQPGMPGMPAYGVLQDHSQATVALVLGIIGLCTGLLIVSPIAWWLGRKAVDEIDATPGVYNNRGMAQAGYITGLIGTILLALGIFFFVATMVLFVAV